MPTISSIRNVKLTPIIVFSMMTFFWLMSDHIITFITPTIMESNGLSVGMVGLIIGTSSITGALFDLVFLKLFKNTNFRRLLLLSFAICLVYPLVLMQSKTIWMFLFAMALWGIYCDLYNYGNFNFIGKFIPKRSHTSAFGLVGVARGLADFLAPLIAGFVIASSFSSHIFKVTWFFLGVAIIFFLVLVSKTRKPTKTIKKLIYHKNKSTAEIDKKDWVRIFKEIRPSLFITIFITLLDAFFWTLAPLFIVKSSLGWYGGLFLSAYSLPFILAGWFVGSITKKYGNRRTANIALLIGSAFLIPFALFNNSPLSILVVFISSCFIGMSVPANNAIYANSISENLRQDSKIIGIENLLYNLGWIFGPISAGLIAELFSIPIAFSVIGCIGIAISVLLLIFTPKKIYYKY